MDIVLLHFAMFGLRPLQTVDLDTHTIYPSQVIPVFRRGFPLKSTNNKLGALLSHDHWGLEVLGVCLGSKCEALLQLFARYLLRGHASACIFAEWKKLLH